MKACVEYTKLDGCEKLRTSRLVTEGGWDAQENEALCISQFQQYPSPPLLGNPGAFSHVVSPGGEGFAILSWPEGWAFAYPRENPGHLTFDIWLQHRQQVAENRSKGAEKAKVSC